MGVVESRDKCSLLRLFYVLLHVNRTSFSPSDKIFFFFLLEIVLAVHCIII